MPDAEPQARKATIREQARKNRVAQPDKDAVSRGIVSAFTALPEYAVAQTVLFYVDAASEVRTRHSLPEALGRGKRIVVPYCLVETNELGLFLLHNRFEELRDCEGRRVSPPLGKVSTFVSHRMVPLKNRKAHLQES